MWKLIETCQVIFIVLIFSFMMWIDSLIKISKAFRFTSGQKLSFEYYFESLQTCLQNDKVYT